MITAIDGLTGDAVEDFMVPKFREPPSIECASRGLAEIVHEYKELFQSIPGSTDVAQHFIPTIGTPVKVPPRRTPARYRQEVESQLQDMLDRGIIEESSSPWMAPTVFVPKKSGDLRICIDYRALNKLTEKDAAIARRSSGPTFRHSFSKLDLHSGYWQMPVHPDHHVLDQEWDYSSSAECLLVWQELLALFNA